VSLGRALGLKTTAEGIESEEALELLIKLGCNTGQGYLFGRPEPASVVSEAFHEETRAVGKTGKESTRSHWTA
jgi:EAL domain-containing protein (putative c-di-GMP-specific phosphodiesterase class I)